MPELPEVETIRIGLSKKIVGLKIKKVSILNPKSFHGDSKLLEGKVIISLFRKAKILGIKFEDNLVLLAHLKMSGQLIYQGKDKFIGGHPTPDMKNKMPNKSTRVIFEFIDKSKLYFNDQRKFGWIKAINNDQLTISNYFNKLGPEPLEKKFTWQVLRERVKRRKKTAIKVVLMDQQVLSGIGNIYASEALFNAKLNPNLRVDQLSDKEYKRLHQGIQKALQDGIKFGGSSRAHFVDAEGKKGYFLDFAYVYGRDKKPCKNCETKIEKLKIGGRGTYFCPNCQRFV